MLATWLQQHWWRPQPSWLAQLLTPLSALYAWAEQAARQRAQAQTVGVPVIVVGNMVVGGAGKTPTTIALVRALQQLGFKPGVVSRGFGRDTRAQNARASLHVTPHTPAGQVGDEPLLIHLRTQVPVVVHADRVQAALELLGRHPTVNVLVSDDGLQHHRLARDGQVIVVDERGFGNGRLLPGGPLREPILSQPPARSVVLYNAEARSTPWPGALAERQLRGAVSLAGWWRAEAATPEALQALGQHALHAAAGIAAPDRFFALLRRHDLQFESHPLPDHDRWDSMQARLASWLGPHDALLVTEKDAVKLDPEAPGADRVWVAPLDFGLPDSVVQAVVTWVQDAASPNSAHRSKP